MEKLTTAQPYIAEINAYYEEFETMNKVAQKMWKLYKLDQEKSNFLSDKPDFAPSILTSTANLEAFILYGKPPSWVAEKYPTLTETKYSVMAKLAENFVSRVCDEGKQAHRAFKSMTLQGILEGRIVVRVEYDPKTAVEDIKIPVNAVPDPSSGNPIFIDPDGAPMGPEESAQVEQGPEGFFISSQVEKQVSTSLKLCAINARDFGHNVASCKNQIWMQFFRHEFYKWEVEEKFGKEIADRLQYEIGKSSFRDGKAIKKGTKGSNANKVEKRVEIFEVWDKRTKKVYFIALNVIEEVIAELDPPFELTEFFPVEIEVFNDPETDGLEGTVDYVAAAGDLKSLEALRERMWGCVAQIGPRGFYDQAHQDSLAALFKPDKNGLFPTVYLPSQVSHTQAGEIVNSVVQLPYSDAVSALQVLTNQEMALSQRIQEKLGIPDLWRGMVNPNETATASGVKDNVAKTRVTIKQEKIGSIIQRVGQLVLDIGIQVYSDDEFLDIAGASSLDEKEQQLVPDAMEGLRGDYSRALHLDIETGSTNSVNEEERKGSIAEFVNAMGGLMPMLQSMPPLQLVGTEILRHATQLYSMGRQVEGSLDKAVEMIENQVNNPAPPQPSPEEQKLEVEKQRLQQEAMMLQAELSDKEKDRQAQAVRDKVETEKALADKMLELQKLELKKQELQSKHRAELNKSALDFQKVKYVEASKDSRELEKMRLQNDARNKGTLGSTRRPTN